MLTYTNVVFLKADVNAIVLAIIKCCVAVPGYSQLRALLKLNCCYYSSCWFD